MDKAVEEDVRSQESGQEDEEKQEEGVTTPPDSPAKEGTSGQQKNVEE